MSELKRKNVLLFYAMSGLSQLSNYLKSGINLIFFLIIKRSIDIAKTKYSDSILFINSEKMGDIVVSINFMKSFQEQAGYRNMYILLCEEYCQLFNLFSLDYNVIAYNKRRYRFNLYYRIETLRKINSLDLKTVVNISPERGALNDELTIMSGAKTKIGLRSKSLFQSSFFLHYYNKDYTCFIESRNSNKYEELNDLLGYFNLKPAVGIEHSTRDERVASGNYVVRAPSASDTFRNWDKVKFKNLVTKLKHNNSIILVGTGEQFRIMQYIADNSTNVELAIDLSWDELVWLVRNCRLYIGLDSGLSHLATYLESPSIVIIGGGKYGDFFPYKNVKNQECFYYQMDCFNCNWNCKYYQPYCINNITVEEIYDACSKILSVN